MKNIYDLLNGAKEHPEDMDAPALTEIERAQLKRGFRRAAGLSHKKAATRWAAAAACLVLLAGFSQTAFAKEAINGILQRISLGNSVVLQIDPKNPPKPQPVYDKDGNQIDLKSLKPGETVDIYDKDGKTLGTIGNGAAANTDRIIEKDLDKAKERLSFQPLLPAALPSGYSFDRAEFYADENGTVSGDYVDFYYTGGGERIFVQERRNTPEARTETGAETVKKLTINGHDAVMMDGDALEWETDDVSVYIVTQRNLSEEELTAFAESFE